MQENIRWNNNSTAGSDNGGNRDGIRGGSTETLNAFARPNDSISSFENLIRNNRTYDFNINIQQATVALLYPLAKGFDLLMNMAPMQRQHLLNAALIYQQQQQQITEIILKQQKLALTRALAAKSLSEFVPLNSVLYNNNNNRHEATEDEISKSLKMFAMLTAPKNVSNFGNNSTIATSTPGNASSIDAVMQDFANNGCVSDDLSFQMAKNKNNDNNNVDKTDSIINKKNKKNFYYNATQMGSWANQNNLSPTTLFQNASSNLNTAYSEYNYQQQQQRKLQQQQYIGLQQQVNVNFNNNLLNITSPSTFDMHQQQEQLNLTNATAMPLRSNLIDFNNSLNNNKKFMKRSGGIRKDKYTGVQHCVFCENNNEPEAVVKSHAVRDVFGKVLCPKLRVYVCPICKASGDYAHTLKYCPQKRIITMEDVIQGETALKAEDFVKNQLFKRQ